MSRVELTPLASGLALGDFKALLEAILQTRMKLRLEVVQTSIHCR